MINACDHSNRWLKVMVVIDGSIVLSTTFCFILGALKSVMFCEVESKVESKVESDVKMARWR